MKHLVTLLDQLHELGVAFVSLGEGIDCTTPAGRLQLHVLAALAKFEKARIVERVQQASSGPSVGGGRWAALAPSSLGFNGPGWRG